jgi:hypothetical protein
MAAAFMGLLPQTPALLLLVLLVIIFGGAQV